VSQPIENRLLKLRKSLVEKNIDTLMVLIAENRRYLSGFTGEDGQFDESAGALFVTDTRLMLLTDSRYDLQASREAPLFEIVCHKKGLIKAVPGILRELHTEKLGLESVRISFAKYREMEKEIRSQGLSVDLMPLENLVENQRIIKEKSEIDATRKALNLAEQVFREVAGSLKVGMTEKEIAWAMEKGMREGGADALSFPAIVASGANSALPHAIPGNRPVKTGEPILFDWGVRLNGYCSDTSRTLILGKPNDMFLKVYRTVLEA